MAMREITLPELNGYDFCASHGIFSSERDVKAAVAYDLQQEMRFSAEEVERILDNQQVGNIVFRISGIRAKTSKIDNTSKMMYSEGGNEYL